MIILGISAYYHDSAASLVKDGVILSSVQEERFTRKKHDAGFPKNAIQYCLLHANITPQQIDYVAYYEKPLLKFERLLETYLHYAPRGFLSFVKSMPVWLKEKIFLANILNQELNEVFDLKKKNRINWNQKLLFTEHHQSHAASAFYPSPFQNAAILTLDGVGEWATTSIGQGIGNQVKLLREIHFPHSLGLLYSAFTYYTGFRVNSGEYKVMGLAPYGKPKYYSQIRDHLIDIKEDGSFRLNMDYFNYCTGLTMTSQKFHDLFGGPPRIPESRLTQKEMDLACSIQKVTEEAVVGLAKFALKETGEKNLCLAGGVALNCVANGKIIEANIAEKIWIQPAAGDAGGSLGAALSVWYHFLNNTSITHLETDLMHGACLGPEFSNTEIETFLTDNHISFEYANDQKLYEKIALLLSQENVIGWFQGRMEFGPRALGNRSILGDPRSPTMQSKMNLRIKYRESFRPFAPSILKESLENFFQINHESPYMLLVAPVQLNHRISLSPEQQNLWGIDLLNIPKSDIPAVTHVDYSARIQSVTANQNSKYYQLIKAFDNETHIPVIINTSFNVRGEPIVCSPQDAYRCFMRTGMDYLVMGNYILDKTRQQKLEDNVNWLKEFGQD